MELFEQIRREYEFGIGTISGVSRKLQVHRRLVREALGSAVPAERKPQARRLRKLQAASAMIDAILMADRQAPPKQRHSARRIWQRLCAELSGFRGSERSVRGYVRRRRQQLGLLGREVFVPQSYEWGVEAQVDWYEASAVLGGDVAKIFVFRIATCISEGQYCQRVDDLGDSLLARDRVSYGSLDPTLAGGGGRTCRWCQDRSSSYFRNSCP